tara:strand:- start:71 stop:4228 length:4158 start_codon:yes stop_codon:yes gene_type:complete
MSEAYKKFTAQDYAVVPFNAHKQYNFTSQSAEENQITWHSVSWTSESVSLYSSASSLYGGDTKNVIKYNQLDHLFYRNFKKSIFDRFGYNNYLQQQRKLYKTAQILSIPAGLYGHEVKPGEFLLSSSNYQVIDDTYGNLIISGTNINHYPSDIRKNIFKLEPVNAFKAYDLDTIPGYAVKLTDPQNKEVGITKRFWRRGVEHPDATPRYSTPNNLLETDESYYHNEFTYNKVNFSRNNNLGINGNNYSQIDFDSKVGSYITSPHNDKFNFNNEDFSISFYIDPDPVGGKILNTSSSIGLDFGGGRIFDVDPFFIYIISKEAIGTFSNQLGKPYVWGVMGANSNAGVGNVTTGPGFTPKLGDGIAQLINMKNADGGATGTLGTLMDGFIFKGYDDWYIPTLTEIHTANENLDIIKGFQNATPVFPFPELTINPDFKFLKENLEADSADFTIPNALPHTLLTSTEASSSLASFPNQYIGYPYPFAQSGVNPVPLFNTFLKDFSLSNSPKTFLPIRRVPRGPNSVFYDKSKRYVICKSGTQTVSPSNLNPGTQTIKNNAISGSSQPLDIPSQPQFPFEVYMQSQSLYFARSDGKKTIAISAELTGSSKHPEFHHVLVQKSSSIMEIHIDGNKIKEASDSTLEETRNLANLYIGSKGIISKDDTLGSDTKFFNGSISCINIWNNQFNTASIKNISESIDASPYIGNIFYQNGFATITKPNVQDIEVPTKAIFEFNPHNVDRISERVFNFNYNNEPFVNIPTPMNGGLDVKPDGTGYFYVERRVSSLSNTVAGFSNADRSLQHKFPMMVYNHELSTPYSFVSQSTTGNNVGSGAYLTGTTAHALGQTASYATISASLPILFLQGTQDIKFSPDGLNLYLVGNGHDILSGSQHPTMAEMDNHFTQTNPSTGNTYNHLDLFRNHASSGSTYWRFLGGLIQIPLTFPFNISSGSDPGNTNNWNADSFRINQAKVHRTEYYKFSSMIGEQTITPSQKYYRRGGETPMALAFKPDGTKFFTAHDSARVRFDAGDTRNGSMGPDLYLNPLGLPSGPNTKLDSTYNIIEHNLEIPWDISSIETTGEYFQDNLDTPLPNSSSIAINKNPVNFRYGHSGRVLDLTSLISPEGYPIKVRSIEFNNDGTKMFLASQASSISEPTGTRFAAGGWGTKFLAVNGWIPATNFGTETQGTRLWEYRLEVPWDILSAYYVNSTPLAKPGGILERSFPTNDVHIENFGIGGNGNIDQSGTLTDYRFVDSFNGLTNLRFIDNGNAYVITNFRGRSLSKVIIGSSTTTPTSPIPYKVHFQGSHLIFEHEYQCTIDEYEFNDTLNISARKIRSQDSHELADFTSSSLFKPYVTTIGLYNEENELLVVGKLGQPVRASDETDTTFVLRWDT